MGTQSLKLITIIALMAVGCTKQSLPLNRVSNSMPPSSLDVTFTTSEDTILFAKLDGRDPENEQLTYKIESNGSIGRAILTNSRTGDFKYIPNANISGVDFFTYSVTDGRGESTPATVTISIITQNDPPDLSQTVTDITMNEGEDYPDGAVVSEDIDSATVSYRLLDSPDQGIFNFNNATGTFSFEPPSQYFGDDLFFRFDATDGADTSPPVTIRFYITNVPDAPTTQNVNASTSQDEPLENGDFLANDFDGDVLTYCITSNPAPGTVEISLTDATKFKYTPYPGFTGGDSFKYKVSDSGDCANPNSNESTVTMFVSNVNDAPVTSPFSFNVNEDATYNNSTALRNSFTDADGDTSVTFILISNLTNSAAGSVSLSTTGGITYSPPADYFNTPATRDTFTYQVNDGNGGFSNISTVTITVNPVNDFPTAFPVTVSTNEGTPVINALFNANDKENNQLTYMITSSPAPTQGSVTVNPPATTGTFNFTPFGDFPGTQAQATVRFWYRVADNGTPSQFSSPVPVDVTVNNVNDPPTTSNQAGTVTAGASISFTLTSADVDGDPRTYSIDPAIPSHRPVHGSVSISGSTATYTADTGYSGTDQFTFTVNDGRGLPSSTVTGTVSLTVRSPAVLANSITPSADWGYQYTSTNVYRYLTLTNSGETPAAVSSLTGLSGGFSVVPGGTCPSHTAPFNVAGRVGATNGSCTLMISFLPSNFVAQSPTLTVTYNNGVTASNTISRMFTGQGKGLPGTLDNTFGPGNARMFSSNNNAFGVDSHNAMATQPNGKLLVAGHTMMNGQRIGMLSRYNTDGSLDTGFASGGRFLLGSQYLTDQISFTAVKYCTVGVCAGTIWAVGTQTDSSNSRYIVLMRVFEDGAPDERIAGSGQTTIIVSNGFGIKHTVSAIDIDLSGRLLITGSASIQNITRDGSTFERTSYLTVRVNESGRDYSFASGSATSTFDNPNLSDDKANAVIVQPDGKVLVAGTTNIGAASGGDMMSFARYNNNGTPDTSFGTGGSGRLVVPFTATGNAGVRSLNIVNNRIVGVGYAGTDFGVAVLDMNGNLDTNFDTDGRLYINFNTNGPEIAYASAVVPGTNFVAMVGVAWNATQGKYDAAIARINVSTATPGGIDNTFGGGGRTLTNFGSNHDVKLTGMAIDTTSLQKIYATGNYSIGTSTTELVILRYWNQ